MAGQVKLDSGGGNRVMVERK